MRKSRFLYFFKKFCILTDPTGSRVGDTPRISPAEAAGVHDVTYLPPSEPDVPYKVGK
jgi:hypothetical protein